MQPLADYHHNALVGDVQARQERAEEPIGPVRMHLDVMGIVGADKIVSDDDVAAKASDRPFRTARRDPFSVVSKYVSVDFELNLVFGKAFWYQSDIMILRQSAEC